MAATLRKPSDNESDVERRFAPRTIPDQVAEELGAEIVSGRRKAGESKRKLVQFAFGFLKTLQKLRKFQQAARREVQTAGREAQTTHSKTETK